MIVKPGFEPVHEAFQSLFDEGLELGARFTAVLGDETVVDLYAGHADRARSRPFGADTLTPVFSTTKALAALLIARLVEAGKLDYAATVASVWPEFAQGGKAGVTIEQALTHQAGLCGFTEPMDPALWFDWDAICAKLAAMEPLWSIGSQSGYHPVTFGYIAGEIFRRIDGRTMGRALREDLCDPLSLDLWIGLPDSEFARVAELERPRSLPEFGEVNAATRAAFMTPWAAPGGRGGAEWRRAEIPSANGHATADSLARLMGRLATSGEGVLGNAARARLSAERIRGKDLVLPFEMSWGAGVMRNGAGGAFGPNPAAFGHSGWGGSCAFCDPDAGLGAAYVMNRQHADLMGDVRAVRLITALYDCL